MSRALRSTLCGALIALAACATTPKVSTEQLPLKRVVIYRNGVGYFERAGKVTSERLEFQVRPDHVGDFLATLAVMESGGSSVRAASFPLREPSESEDDEAAQQSKLSTVTLELDGEEHDLAVGYVAEQPVWKPSYRLVFEKGEPVLQAWGIVQNVSGEDWKDVSLSLIAGAPIAFRSTLGTPVIPARPVVSDSGEVIAAVPRSETTLPSEPPPPPAAVSQADEYAPADEAPMAKRAPSRPRAPGAPPPAASAPAPAPPPGRYQQGSMGPKNLALLASRTVQAGATRYDVPSPVTVPNDSATMVLLVAQKVPGESVFMFAPEGGVPDSSRHPFRVARFKNVTEGLLEKGPVAVFDDGSFVGQGVLEPLSSQAEATVPFALERELAIDQEQRWEQLDARLAKIEHGQLTIERDQVLRTAYRIRNGGEKEARLIVRHPRQAGMRLHAPPLGTDDQVGKQTALVPAKAPKRGTAELQVEERRAFSTSVDWFSNEADAAVKAYRADRRADPKLVAGLDAAWKLRERMVKEQEELQRVQSEKAIHERAAYEARESLRAISRNKTGVDELRRTLSERLLQLDQKLAELNKRQVELELSLNELRVRFQEQVRALSLKEPLPVT